ncbi:MAG: class E sortase [Actinomycetota bacterium]
MRPSPKLLRRGLTALAGALALGGVGLIAYPFATDLWAARIQHRLLREMNAGDQSYRLADTRVGDPLTRLEIPTLDVDVVVVEGTSQDALRAGAGHYPDTALPGDPGNVAIAGHRTTYGRPFNRMDELKGGDEVILTTPFGRYVYEIERPPWIVSPTDWSIIDEYPTGGSFLTLTSCHPEGSAAYRIVTRARLVGSSIAVGEAS